MTTISAHFDGKVFVPDEPVVGLAPGHVVEVIPSSGALPNDNGTAGEHPIGNDSSGDDPLLRLIGLAVDTGIPDLAENADHYLYGHPKHSERTDGR
jgi:hypothetical protein